MAHYTLTTRISAGNRKFPLLNLQFSKNHLPIAIAGATYYLCPRNSGKRIPIRIGKDVAAAHTALIKMEYGQSLERPTVVQADPSSMLAGASPRMTVAEAAREYIDRSKQKSRKTYLR